MVGSLLTRCLSVACAISAAAATQAPAVPNETLLVGEVLEVTAVDSSALNIEPPQALFRLRLRLVSARRVPPKASFLKAGPGEVVEVYSKQVVSPRLVGKLIIGRVTFRGDELGGRHWVLEMTEQ